MAILPKCMARGCLRIAQPKVFIPGKPILTNPNTDRDVLQFRVETRLPPQPIFPNVPSRDVITEERNESSW